MNHVARTVLGVIAGVVLMAGAMAKSAFMICGGVGLAVWLACKKS